MKWNEVKTDIVEWNKSREKTDWTNNGINVKAAVIWKNEKNVFNNCVRHSALFVWT